MILPYPQNSDFQIEQLALFASLIGYGGDPVPLEHRCPFNLVHAPVFEIHIVDGKEIVSVRCSCNRKDCPSPGKHPHDLWRGVLFSDKSPNFHTFEYVLRQLRNPIIESTHVRPQYWNTGCILGGTGYISKAGSGMPECPPNGLVVIDFDYKGEKKALAESLENEIRHCFPVTKQCLIVKTGNQQSKHYYLHADSSVDNYAGFEGKTLHYHSGADIKSGASWTATPGSRHKSGEYYVIANAALPVPVEHAKPILEFFKDKLQLNAKPSTAAGSVSASVPSNFEIPASDDSNLHKRLSGFIRKKPSTQCGKGECHNKTFEMAMALVVGFDLTIEEAYPWLAEWVSGSTHEWTERELWHKLKSAEQKGGNRGELLNKGIKREKETFPHKIKKNLKSARATAATAAATTVATAANPILMEEPVLPRAIPIDAPAGANAHSKPHTPPATSRIVPPTKPFVPQGLSDEELDSIGEAIAQARQEKNVGFVSSSSSSPTSLDSYRDRFCPRYRSFMLWDGKTRTNIVFDKPCEKLKCSYCRPRVQAHWMSTIKHHLEALPPDTPIYQFLFRSPDENRNSNPAWDTITTYIRKKKGQYLGVRGTMANTFHVFTTVDPIQDEAEDVDVITPAEAITRLKKLIDDMPTNWCTIGGFHEDLKGYLSSSGWKLLEDPKSDTDKKTFVGELRGPRSEHVKIIEDFGLDFHEGRPRGGYQIKRTSAIVYPKDIDAADVMQKLLDFRYHPRIPDDPAFQWRRDLDKVLKAIHAGEMTVEDVKKEFGGFVPGSKEFAYFYSGLGQCGISFTLNIEGLAREKTVCESPGTA